MRKACCVDGCDIPYIKRGMCENHYRRTMKYGDPLHPGAKAPHGTGYKLNNGYWMHQINGRTVLRHILVAERAVGHRLPKGVHVHHVDYDRSNDANTNLVVCPSAAYHKLLHQRTDALNACGHADWRKCHICKTYDDPANLRFYQPSGLIRHMACWQEQYRLGRAA